MRVRRVGIIVGAALIWAVVPLSASATGCDADADASVAVPGDKSLSVDARCSVPVGNPPASASSSGTVSQDDDGINARSSLSSSDLDGSGEDEQIDSTEVEAFDCPEPEDQGTVTGVACPILQAT